MALIVWKDAMSVGNDALDDDHIVVASLINHIDDAKQSGTDEHAVGRILRVLVDHAFAHFAREEASRTARLSAPGGTQTRAPPR